MTDRRPPDAVAPDHPVRPTREDPFARWASEVVGGPAGRRLAVPAHPWWWAGSVLALVGSAMVALAVLRYQNCRVDGWQSPDYFVHLCYSDVAVLFDATGGTASGVLGLDGDTGVGQPAVSALLMAAIALLVPFVRDLDATLTGTLPAAESAARVYFDLTAVAVAAAVAVTVLAVVGLSGRRPWDAGLVAWSPVVVLAGLVSVDMLGVALGACAVWAWARDRPWLAGLLLGLAVGTRLHLVVIVLALVLLGLRAGRLEPVARTLSVAAVAWALPNLAVLLLAPRAWVEPLRQWWTSEPAQGYGSLWFVVRLVGDSTALTLPERLGPVAAVVSLAAALAVAVAVSAWVLRSPTPPRLPVVVLVLVVGTLVVGKVVPVQASLWLLPWAALAVPQYRDHLWWWAAEAAYVVSVWQHLVGGSSADRALPAGWYSVFLLLRLAAMSWLAWQAVRTVTRPADDPVRGAHSGRDPAAGPLARAAGTGAGAGDSAGGTERGGSGAWPGDEPGSGPEPASPVAGSAVGGSTVGGSARPTG